MRILVVNNFFPPRPGGSSHLSDHLSRAYAAAGHEVLVLTASYRNAPEVEERDGFRIARIPAWILPKNRFAANFDIAFTIGPTSQSRVDRILRFLGGLRSFQFFYALHPAQFRGSQSLRHRLNLQGQGADSTIDQYRGLGVGQYFLSFAAQ